MFETFKNTKDTLKKQKVKNNIGNIIQEEQENLSLLSMLKEASEEDTQKNVLEETLKIKNQSNMIMCENKVKAISKEKEVLNTFFEELIDKGLLPNKNKSNGNKALLKTYFRECIEGDIINLDTLKHSPSITVKLLAEEIDDIINDTKKEFDSEVSNDIYKIAQTVKDKVETVISYEKELADAIKTTSTDEEIDTDTGFDDEEDTEEESNNDEGTFDPEATEKELNKPIGESYMFINNKQNAFKENATLFRTIMQGCMPRLMESKGADNLTARDVIEESVVVYTLLETINTMRLMNFNRAALKQAFRDFIL